MPLVVNSNIPAINAQRNLERSTNALSKSLERLSSGLRINRAGDDAAGMAISESLRSQVRGLNQAVRNARDGVSMVATAEGAIDAYTTILQRIRELSVQSANDTNSFFNRQAIQREVDQQLEELSRIANTVQFNGLPLLDGTFINKQIQAGAMQGQTISISIDDMRATNLGAVAHDISSRVDSLASGDLVLNGAEVGATSVDGISYLDQDSSAIAVARAVNEATPNTSVTAEVEDNIVTGDQNSGIQAFTMDGDTTSGDALVINGINIGAVTVSAGDTSGSLAEAINQRQNKTGVTAEVNDSGELVLTASDGRNITIQTTGSVGGALGLTADTSTNLAGSVADGTYRGTVHLYSLDPFSIGGTATGFSTQSVGVDTDSAIINVDLTTAEGANDAIRMVDFALQQISETRSKLGAITNRLEVTVSNLQIIAENMAASDSRIRDADFAVETAQLTKNQILQQAGVSVLAQANVSPQAALSLLQ